MIRPPNCDFNHRGRSVDGLCRTSIYEALKRGELLAHKRGTRTLILRKDLDHWLASWEPFKRKPSVGGDSSNA